VPKGEQDTCVNHWKMPNLTCFMRFTRLKSGIRKHKNKIK
jgi:hypothetical protein